MSKDSDSLGSGEIMSGEWLWDSSTYRNEFPTENKDFDIATIECWNYEEDEGGQPITPIRRYERRSFHTDSMDSWLKEPIPTHHRQQPSSGFKVVVMPYAENQQFPHLTEEQMQAVNAALGLPYFQKHFSSTGCGACGMFSQSDNSYIFIFQGNTHFTSIGSALRYDPQTNVTRGVFYIALEYYDLDIFKKMPEQFIRCAHPLLLPLLASELSFEEGVHHLAHSRTVLLQVEKGTGYGLTSLGSQSDSQTDYRTLVRKLGQAQSDVHLIQSAINAYQFSTQFIRQKLQHLNRILPEECQRKLKLSYQMLDERAEFLLSNMDHINVWSGLKERMESQQTVLFNLIAQSDNLINVSLAKDSREMAVASKQDSSAMKIIALLTTFFLPGTFIASFFAMPLFDWSEPSLSKVTTHHFWVYWAVTGPITLAIMAAVIAWALWNNRRVQLLQSRARDSVDTKSLGDKSQETDEEQSTESDSDEEQSTSRDSDEGVITNEDQASENETDGVQNLKKYSLLGILSRRRRRSGSTKAEP